MKREGFNLIELVAILVIIGITSVFVVISFNPYKGIKLDAAVKKVDADLLYTRNLALSMAKWYGVSFEVDPVNRYTVYETTGTQDAVIDDPANLSKPFIIDLHNYYGGIRIVGVNIGGGSKLEFHPLGRPYDDRLGAALSTEAVIQLEYAGQTREIRITPNTGRIYIP